MKRLALALLATVALPALAQGVSRPVRLPEAMIMSRTTAVAATAVSLDATVLPADRGFGVTAVTCRVSVQAAGTGNTVLRITDGTNNCDCTAVCATTGSAGFGDVGPKRIPCAGGCTFAAGALLTFSVQTAGCSSTQVTPQAWHVVGNWR